MIFPMILRALVALPPWHEDTAEADRLARLEVVASAVEAAVDRATCWGPHGEEFDDHFAPICDPIWPTDEREKLAALLVALAWHETRLARRWHATKCREGECDSYRDDRGRLCFRAAGLWQVWESFVVRPTLWRVAVSGSDQRATDAQAWAATLVLAAGRSRCGDVIGAVSAYATGYSCRWSGAYARIRTAERIEASFAEVGHEEAPLAD